MQTNIITAYPIIINQLQGVVKKDMIKTFEEQISCDTSWTGGGKYYNDKYLEILDSRINDFALKNKVKITKTEFSSININTQHGSHPNNTTRSIKCIATVHYRNPILGIF